MHEVWYWGLGVCQGMRVLGGGLGMRVLGGGFGMRVLGGVWGMRVLGGVFGMRGVLGYVFALYGLGGLLRHVCVHAWEGLSGVSQGGGGHATGAWGCGLGWAWAATHLYHALAVAG